MEELLPELNPVFARIPIRQFGKRREVIFKRRETWDKPEDCMSGYTDVVYTDDSKTEQGSGAGVYFFKAEGYASLKAT